MKFYKGLINNYFISIKTKIVVFFLIIIIIPILIMAINSYSSSQRLILNKYQDVLLEISKQSNLRIEEHLKDIEKISLLTSYGINSNLSTQAISPVQNFLQDSSDLNENNAYQLLLNAIMMKDRTYSIYIYNLTGGKNLYVSSNKPINFDYNPVNEAWFKDILNSNEAVTIIDTHRDYQIKDKDNWAIASARKIYDMRDGSLLGVIVFSINIDFIDKIYGNILENKRSGFSIVDENNKIVYNNNFNNIGRNLSEVLPIDLHKMNQHSGGFIAKNGNENDIVTYNSFDKQKWKTILYISLDKVSIEGALLKQNLIYIVVILFIFAIASSYIISTQITRPIKKLIKNMSKVEKGNFENLPVINSHDEVGVLSKRFNLMSLELKQLVDRIYVEEKEKAEAEMNALQAQINPHFLYNTLSSLKWMAAIQKSDKIVQMIEALIFMLRYTTVKVGDLVYIKDELENLKHYITIQKVRYYNRIKVEYDISEHCMDCKILKFTIQPIVENAIFHGLSEKEEGGLIKIGIVRQGSHVVITIEDNGVGMDKETMETINENIYNSKGKFNSIGINNVNSRIKMHFGDSYGVRFESELGKGTTFYILLPAVDDDVRIGGLE